MIESGTVSCTQAKSATDATEISLLTLGAGDYFGEMALMLDEPRAANCIAGNGKVEVTRNHNFKIRYSYTVLSFLFDDDFA